MEISCLELSLSLSKTLLSLSFVLARVCMCSTPPSFFLLLILFQIKNLLSQKALSLSLSLSLSLGRSCCLRTTTTIRTAMIEQRRRREKTAASWWWWWRGDSWCTWSRGSLKFGGTKSKMFLSYFSRFVLLLRRYSRYAFALGTTAIAIGAIVVNTSRRIE